MFSGCMTLTPMDWFSICGTILSVIGLGITIWQLIEVKCKTARYQQQVHDEVVSALALNIGL